MNGKTYAIDCILLLKEKDPAKPDGIILYELVKDCQLRVLEYT